MHKHMDLGLGAALLIVSAPLMATCGSAQTQDPRVVGGRTYSVYIPRSAGSNTALKFMPLVYKPTTCRWVFGLDAAVEYTRSINGKDIAQTLFGNPEKLSFDGSYSIASQANNRNVFDLVSDYFGLSPLASGHISFNPRIENINLHVQSYAGLDCWLEGLYAQVNFTFAHQKRALFAGCECQDTKATGRDIGQFPAGYMGITRVPATEDLRTALGGDFTFGDMQTPWKYGKFKFGSMHKNAVAGVDFILGYDFWKTYAGSLGLYLQYTAPTGNEPCPTYVFSPVVGNGKHHEIGAGLRASCKLWENDCNESLYAYFDGHVTSLLKNHQLRSFDLIYKGQNSLIAGTLSRYMLLKELTPNDNSTEYDYAGHLINAINFTTRNVAIKIPVKGDATLRFIYTHNCFDFGFGYNIYGQSHEKIGCLDNFACNSDVAGKFYGVKGTTGVYYFDYLDTGTPDLVRATPFAVATNATASSSAIAGPLAGGQQDQAIDSKTLASADNVSVAGDIKSVDWTSAVEGLASNVAVSDADSLQGMINEGNASSYPTGYYSDPAVALTSADLDKDSGKTPAQLTHKGFVTMNYTWKHCTWEPYFGIGAEVEGGHRVDFKQWGVWIKGGVSF